VNTNNGVKGSRFIMPEKLSKLMTTFKDTYKSKKIKVGVNDMTVNDSEICVRGNNETGQNRRMISVLR